MCIACGFGKNNNHEESGRGSVDTKGCEWGQWRKWVKSYAEASLLERLGHLLTMEE